MRSKTCLAQFVTIGLLALSVGGVADSQTAPATRPHEQPPSTAPSTQPASPPARRTPEIANRLATKIGEVVAESHGLKSWRNKAALQADLLVEVGGKTIIQGTLLSEVHGGRRRWNLPDGTVMAFDGKSTWTMPADAALDHAEFHLTVWPLLLTAPLVLQDPAVRLTAYQPRGDFNTYMLSFAPTGGTLGGRWPDDWFLCYSKPGAHQFHALVTSLRLDLGPPQADRPAQAAIYEQFQDIQGVRLPTSLTLTRWDQNTGFEAEPFGKATITNVKFIIPPPGTFIRPEPSAASPLE